MLCFPLHDMRTTQVGRRQDDDAGRTTQAANLRKEVRRNGKGKRRRNRGGTFGGGRRNPSPPSLESGARDVVVSGTVEIHMRGETDGGGHLPESVVLPPPRNLVGVVADLPKYRVPLEPSKRARQLATCRCGEPLRVAPYDGDRKWPDQSLRETREIGRR